MNIRFLPLERALQAEELASIIQQGWSLWGILPVHNPGGKVATPTNPSAGGACPTAVLIRGPMIPADALLGMMLNAQDLEGLCMMIFNQPLGHLRRKAEKNGHIPHR